MPFRAAAESDLPTLLEMQRDFYAHEGVEFVAAEAEQAMRTLVHDASLGRMFLIEDGGAIAGYVVIMFGFSLEFRGRAVLLDELYVVPEARDRGFGSAALRFVEQFCLSENVRVLQLEVADKNARANALYQRNGFFDRGNRLLSKTLGTVVETRR